MAARRHLVYSTKDLLALQDDPNRWIVPDLIQKSSRVLVFGEGGHYKSALVFDLAVAIASGGNLIRDIAVRQHGPVLINSTEGSIFDNKNRLLSHMRAHNVNPVDVPLFYCQQPYCLDDAQDIRELEHEIQRLRPVLVVLDPLDSFFSGDENSAKETKALRRTVDRFIDEYKCTFIVIHHQAANIGKDGKELRAKPRGSTAWYGWADAVLHVKCKLRKIGLPVDMEVITVEAQKQRNGPKGHMFSAVPFIDKRLNQTTFAFYNGTDASGVVKAYFKDRIHRLLWEQWQQGQAMTNTMLADALGVRPEKLTDALAELEQAGLIAKDGTVARPFGPGGSRTRDVAAWRVRKQLSVVDQAAIMVRDEENELQQYTLEPQPVDTDLGDAGDIGGVQQDGAGPGCRIPDLQLGTTCRDAHQGS